MSTDPARYCATDKEIHDLLMSAKKRITESVLHDLSKGRGIFYSPREVRERLADKLSLLPHGFHDLNELIGHLEHSGRGEKTTSVSLPPLTMEEIKEVAASYSASVSGDEKVTVYQKGTDEYHIDVAYSEIDYSKTRLVQRKQREAAIEFDVRADRTVIRLPANEKAEQIVEDLRTKIAAKKQAEIKAVRIELDPLLSPEQRTRFFTQLISEMPSFTFRNVTRVRVDSLQLMPGDDPDEDPDKEEAAAEMLALVHQVALSGQSLLASGVYQELRERGFFITSIVWDARQSESLSDFQFEAAFDEPRAGTGFRYNVRGVRRHEGGGQYTKTLRPVEKDEKFFLFEILENTASKIRDELTAEAEATQTAEETKA